MKKISFKIEKSKEKISPFGGLFLIGELFKSLHLSEYLDSKLERGNSNASINPSQKILPVILSMICGGMSYSDVDKLLCDAVVNEICGLSEIANSTTINRYYSRYGGKTGDIASSKAIEELGKLSFDVMLRGLKRSKESEVILDQDATYIKSEKREAKKTYKGFRGYSSMCCFIDGYGYCADEEFREGNVSPSRGILPQLERVNVKLKAEGIKVKRVRNDSAGYQSEVFNYCFEEGIEFFIGGVLDRAVRAGISSIDEGSWSPYVDKYGVKSDEEEISEFIHCMEKTNKSFRMIVIRKKHKEYNRCIFKEEMYEYRVIATNSDLGVMEVVHIYNERGRCEYYIKEAKYGFNLKHLPSGDLGGNGLWFKTGILAYNLIMLLKNNVFDGSFAKKEMKSIRYLIISIGAKLIYHGGKILKLCCSEEMLDRLLRWRKICLTL